MVTARSCVHIPQRMKDIASVRVQGNIKMIITYLCFSRSCLSSTLRPLTSNRLIAEMTQGKTDLPVWNVFTPHTYTHSSHTHPHTTLHTHTHSTHTLHTHTPLSTHTLLTPQTHSTCTLAHTHYTHTSPHTHTPHTHTPLTPHSHWRQVAARCYTSGESMVVVTLHPQSLSLVRYLISCLHGNTCCYGCRRRLQLRKRN